MRKTTTLKKLLNKENVLVAPGVYDGLSARLAELAGFDAIYASGGAIARSTGRPDIGLLTLTEVINRLEEIIEVTNVPVIADADTGFGNALNVRRMIRMLENTGVAGCHIEDQEFPKRCGHLDGKRLVSQAEMCEKIQVALDTLTDPDFLLIARTDAIAVEGIESALIRAKAYLAAGAHMIFVEAPTSLGQIEQIAAEIPEPKLINMFYGGKTPLVEKQKLAELGYKLIIIPSDSQRAAAKAIQDTFAVIHKHGDSSSMQDRLLSFNEREAIINTKAYLNFED